MTRALVALLASIVLVAGCMGGSDVGFTGGTTDSISTDDGPDPTDTGENPGGKEKERRMVNNFYHVHNMWHNRTEVYVLKEQEIFIGEDPQEETQTYQDKDGVLVTVVGFRCFDSAIDGKHNDPNTDRADVVFQGTNRLKVKVDWTAIESKGERMPGLTFTYQHAGSNIPNHVQDIEKNMEFEIPVIKEMADMAHSDDISRWEFCLEAFDGDSPAVANQRVMAAKGTAKVTIRSLYGGKDSIDEPHPLNFVDNTTYDAGDVRKNNLKATAIELPDDTVPEDRRRQGEWDRLFGWKLESGKFIPWDAHTLRIWMWYNYTGAYSGVEHRLLLQYTDASDAKTVRTPDPKETKPLGTTGESLYYEFNLKGTTIMDDAYAQDSDWRFGVRPVVEADPDRGGDFEGNVHIKVLCEGDDSPYFAMM